MIQRILQKALLNKLCKKKVILLCGARQVGKTTLVRHLLDESGKRVLFLDCDDITVRQLLDQPNTAQLKQIIGNAQLIFIDEAQRIHGIGITAKIMADQFKDRQLILSGSSSFELNETKGEALTGRKWSFELFPVSWEE